MLDYTQNITMQFIVHKTRMTTAWQYTRIRTIGAFTKWFLHFTPSNRAFSFLSVRRRGRRSGIGTGAAGAGTRGFGWAAAAAALSSATTITSRRSTAATDRGAAALRVQQRRRRGRPRQEEGVLEEEGQRPALRVLPPACPSRIRARRTDWRVHIIFTTTERNF